MSSSLRHPISALLALLAVALSGCGGAATRNAETITVYGPGPVDWYRSQFEAFTTQTGIKVDYFPTSSGEAVSRVNSPAVWDRLDKESVPPADVMFALPPFIQKAAKAGLLQASGADTTGIPAQSVGPGGLYVPIMSTASTFIANPAANPPPLQWNDLLRPGLKGKVQYSTPGEAADGTAVLLLLQHLMGKQGALDYLTKLQANSAGPSSATFPLQSKVASGELVAANGDLQLNLFQIRNGSKYSIVFPAMADGSRTTLLLPYSAGVTTQSQRPEAAKKLVAFMLSDEVQKSVLSEVSGIPARNSLAAGTPADFDPMTPAGALRGVTIWTPDWNTVMAELDSDIAAYKKATGT